MKKVILLLGAFVFRNLAFSQVSSIQDGNNCFTKGDYACAIDKYKVGLVTTDQMQKRIASSNLKVAEACLRLLRSADSAYSANNFLKAKEYYQSVLNENAKDEYARTRFKLAQNKLFTLTLPEVRVAGNFNINYGESATLKIEGGSLNGKAVWRWFVHDCGDKAIATGESVKVTPQENENYYVRAESTTDTSLCILVSIKVDPNSKEPERIDGKKTFCPNEKNIPLSVEGGKLGKGARWSWYQDSLKGTHLGYGTVIYVSPVKKTTYYLIAEGGPNNISPVTFEMDEAEEKFIDPEKITGNSLICSGTPLELEVTGGKISQYASWTWYKNDLNKTNEVGKGRKIIIYPSSSAKYLVRGEGSCINTNTKSISIEVTQSTVLPGSIQVSSAPNNKRQIKLSIYGGSLGNNANWVWFKDDCNSNRQVGSGKTIFVKPKKATHYYVKAVGGCNTTSCLHTTVYPRTVDKFIFVNFGTIVNANENGTITGFQKAGEGGKVYSLTFGKLAKTGWYVRAKFNSTTNLKQYTIENNVIYGQPGSYYVYNNEITFNRLSATCGITKKLAGNTFLLFGAGYGQRELLWGIDEYSNSGNVYMKSGWGNNKSGYYVGPEVEAGLLIKVAIFNISFGANSIVYNTQTGTTFNQKPYFDYQMGIGFTF